MRICNDGIVDASTSTEKECAVKLRALGLLAPLFILLLAGCAGPAGIPILPLPTVGAEWEGKDFVPADKTVVEITRPLKDAIEAAAIGDTTHAIYMEDLPTLFPDVSRITREGIIIDNAQHIEIKSFYYAISPKGGVYFFPLGINAVFGTTSVRSLQLAFDMNNPRCPGCLAMVAGNEIAQEPNGHIMFDSKQGLQDMAQLAMLKAVRDAAKSVDDIPDAIHDEGKRLDARGEKIQNSIDTVPEKFFDEADIRLRGYLDEGGAWFKNHNDFLNGFKSP